MIAYAVDVLAWHAVLFRVFPSGSGLTREKAGETSNEAAVLMLPASEQPAARAVLARYCVAFNHGLLPRAFARFFSPFLFCLCCFPAIL